MRSQPRRLWLVVLLIALVAISAMLTGFASAQKNHRESDLPAACKNNPITFKEFQPFVKSVWDFSLWKRDKTTATINAAYAHKLKCAAGPNHRAAMTKEWESYKNAFHKFRKGTMWRHKYKPYVYPDGSHWAAPYPIAWCESGGDYYVGPAGAYGEIERPSWQPPKVQDEVAHQLMAEGKEYSAWVEWEGECQYR